MEQIAEFVDKARAGHKEAWEKLIQRIYPQGLNQARMLLRDRDLAEDALQNALIKVYRNLHSLENATAFYAWFRRILVNEVYLILRTRQRETGELDQRFMVDPRLSVEDHVTLKLEIFQALQALPLEQQQILIEVDLRGESLQKVTEDYDLPLGTVKSRLFRARERLRKQLQEDEVRNQKEMERIDMKDEQTKHPLSEQFYDYLEGTMTAEEKVRFEKEWLENPEWSQELKKHKDFLTLLHTMTGRLTLTAQEIAEKVRQVNDQIQDYELTQEQTFFDAAGAKTLTSHLWFKRPGQYRFEGSNPMLGETVTTVRGQEMMSWSKTSNQAQRLKFSQEFKNQMAPNYSETLRKMAEDKKSRVLGTEYIEGRPALHIQFIEKVPNLGEMNTHLWLDKETWMPLVSEYYNSDGKLIMRNLVRNLKLNQGLPDSCFELKIPDGVEIKEEERTEVLPLQEITLEEAAQRLGHGVYVLMNEAEPVKHQWIHIASGQGALMSQYKKAGEPLAYLTLTQGNVAHHNIPPQVPCSKVQIAFDEKQVEGTYFAIDLGIVASMLVWECDGMYYTAGSNESKETLLGWVERLGRVS